MSNSPMAAVELTGIEKRFGAIKVLHNVSFAINAGEVVGLVGDNGAGKSTTVRIMSGALQPDRGDILIQGRKVRFDSPIAARRQGIETVYQDLALAPHLSVKANLFLNREELRPGLLGALGFLDERRMAREAVKKLELLRIKIKSMDQLIQELSGGQRQAIAVARAASWGSRLVILDEPTAALGVEESQMVLDLIRRVRDSGVPVLLISHTMPHVFEVTDRIVVLRQGRVVATAVTKECTLEDVIMWITGAAVHAG
ncbi:MAG: sugar ABC transporter ATP-binding protein [Sulfobacillus acidophilus]|uniref:Sugar ABC transporter ATP-binding protein n=1 Tax=Sulfobacillus acidophilus TaxID=53633 RepID=A0A2T2WE67_9FIRM|nr:MAG: sugar ABC transporter ATP-binding protein [Sulfobacillus acidophilus]